MTRIILGLSSAALLWSALITQSVGALVALGFYSTLAVLVVSEVRAARRRPPRRMVQTFARPGVPIVRLGEGHEAGGEDRRSP